MAETQGMSLNPETFTEGGGLIDDVNVTWNKVRFEMFDYQGKSEPAPTLKVDMETDEGEEASQNWSMGSAKDWAPSPDGKKLVAVGSATGIRANSNGGILLKSLADSGYPMDTLGDDVSALEGLQCHMIRVPAPKRAGLKSTRKREDGREFEQTILTVDEIIALPGEKKKAAGAPSGKKAAPKTAAKKSAPKAKAEPAGDVDEKARETVLGIVLEEGEVTKKMLPTKVFQVLKADPDRNAVAKLVFDDEFLASGEWAYDAESGVLSMPE